MNVALLGLQGFLLSAAVPWLLQMLKPKWLKGQAAVWAVWLGCCGVAAVYLVVTGQVPAVVWSDPVQATTVVLGFGSAITALARQWYEALEKVMKKVPSLWG